MSSLVIGLALLAAALHATWNAVLRSGADRLWSITVMSFATTVVAIPVAVLLPFPSAGSWPFLVLSSCLQVGYSVFLVVAYRRGELAQVYPIMRGSVPLLVTLGGLLIGQHLSTRVSLGIILVACGIMSLSLGKGRATMESILPALVTGLFVACYTVIDALGVRLAGDARVYAAWIFLIYGVLMPLTFVAVRGNLELDIRSAESRKALAGGVVSLLSYGAMLTALALGSVGPVSALRETSVVFAALIGRIFLGEIVTIRRAVACAVVAVGAICIGA